AYCCSGSYCAAAETLQFSIGPTHPQSMPAVSHGNATFQFPIRVYYEDTDAGGVVYYANYLKFFERARTEWLRTLGFGQAQMADLDGRIFVVPKASTEYRLPARLDDELTVHSQIHRI